MKHMNFPPEILRMIMDEFLGKGSWTIYLNSKTFGPMRVSRAWRDAFVDAMPFYELKQHNQDDKLKEFLKLEKAVVQYFDIGLPAQDYFGDIGEIVYAGYLQQDGSWTRKCLLHFRQDLMDLLFEATHTLDN